jgi:hypothetical protein
MDQAKVQALLLVLKLLAAMAAAGALGLMTVLAPLPQPRRVVLRAKVRLARLLEARDQRQLAARVQAKLERVRKELQLARLEINQLEVEVALAEMPSPPANLLRFPTPTSSSIASQPR